MSVNSRTVPFDNVAMMYLVLIRVRPGAESGHGVSRCQVRLNQVLSSSLRPLMPNFSISASSPMRCSASRLVHGSSPVRTRFIDALHRMGLDALIEKFGIKGLNEEDKTW